MTRLLHHLYRRFHAVTHRMKRRLTPTGLFLAGALIASAVVGIDTNRTLAYQAFTFVLAILCLAMGWSLFFRGRFAAHRILPRFATAGQPFSYRVTVSNLGNRSQGGLFLLEESGDPRPDYRTFADTPEPGEERRNRFDRASRFYRWLWLLSIRQPRLPGQTPLPVIPPGGRGEVTLSVTPVRRGALDFSGLTVARPDPLGVCRGFVRVPARQSVTVLPRRYPVPPLRLPGRRRYQSGGVALTVSVGDSEEFVSVRDYRPGDPLRRIHWKSWAKVRKPMVKEHQEEFFVRHALVLDTFTRTGHSEIFEEAVSVAASFVCTVQTQDSLLDLVFVGPEAYCFTSGRGIAQSDRLLEVLAGVVPCRKRTFDILLPAVLQRAPALSGCICVLLAWDEVRRDFISRLRAVGTPVLVLVVTGPDDPAPDPGPMRDDPRNFRRLRVGSIPGDLAAV